MKRKLFVVFLTLMLLVILTLSTASAVSANGKIFVGKHNKEFDSSHPAYEGLERPADMEVPYLGPSYAPVIDPIL